MKLLAENDFPEEVPVHGLDRWLPKEDINDTESKTSYNVYCAYADQHGCYIDLCNDLYY